jgi:CheY-like chemotaxis protein
MPSHRVLVVDDYPEAADVVCTLVRLLGHECRSALTGAEALEIARAFQPEIALVDLGLPDISGFELAGRLRELAEGRPLYLAAVSGWAEPQDRARALAAGFDRHLLKPIDGATARRLIDGAAPVLAPLSRVAY